MLCDLSFREDSLPVKRQKLERYQLFMLELEQTAHFEDLFEKGHKFVAPTPAKKRGRPKKSLAEDTSEQSLADVFTKKKR